MDCWKFAYFSVMVILTRSATSINCQVWPGNALFLRKFPIQNGVNRFQRSWQFLHFQPSFKLWQAFSPIDTSTFSFRCFAAQNHQKSNSSQYFVWRKMSILFLGAWYYHLTLGKNAIFSFILKTANFRTKMSSASKWALGLQKFLKSPEFPSIWLHLSLNW